MAEIHSSNIFSLKTKMTEQEIKDDIPEIKDIKIYKGIPNAIKVVVIEYEGAFVWQSAGNYYLVSQSGVVFQDITSETAKYVNLPRVQDARALPLALGDRIATGQFVNFVKDIFENIKTDANLDPDYFAVDETTVDLALITKNGFYVKFDTLRDLKTQKNNLKMVLVERKPEIKEYIDLRINGWVYFK